MLLIAGMTRVGIYTRTNDTHETGPPSLNKLPREEMTCNFSQSFADNGP